MSTIHNKQTFRQFCEMELSQAKFNELYKIEGFSKNKITKALNSPASMSFQLLKAIAEKTNYTPFFLAETYDAAMDSMSAKEYKQIEKAHTPIQ